MLWSWRCEAGIIRDQLLRFTHLFLQPAVQDLAGKSEENCRLYYIIYIYILSSLKYIKIYWIYGLSFALVVYCRISVIDGPWNDSEEQSNHGCHCFKHGNSSWSINGTSRSRDLARVGAQELRGDPRSWNPATEWAQCWWAVSKRRMVVAKFSEVRRCCKAYVSQDSPRV